MTLYRKYGTTPSGVHQLTDKS